MHSLWWNPETVCGFLWRCRSQRQKQQVSFSLILLLLADALSSRMNISTKVYESVNEADSNAAFVRVHLRVL